MVLTHDVEEQVGLDKCRELMRLEIEFGFRSSFNFIPEGDYEVPRGSREGLTQNGFEVGIHDLNHATAGFLHPGTNSAKERPALSVILPNDEL